MSDFFYKEKLGAAFAPVISVKRDETSTAVLSAIDNLLSPCGNMFTRAETVRTLMKLENLNLDSTAKALSLKRKDVANKLRLLEFSDKERDAVLEYGFSENSALEFLKIDKISRLYSMEYCKRNGYDDERILQYVQQQMDIKQRKMKESCGKAENVRKFSVNDPGFFFNSNADICFFFFDEVIFTFRPFGKRI